MVLRAAMFTGKSNVRDWSGFTLNARVAVAGSTLMPFGNELVSRVAVYVPSPGNEIRKLPVHVHRSEGK